MAGLRRNRVKAYGGEEVVERLEENSGKIGAERRKRSELVWNGSIVRNNGE